MIPDDLSYTDQHEWIRLEGETATVGITDHAQQQLGDMTFVELPSPGQKCTKGQEVLSVESCKAAASVYAPADGEVTEVNDSLEDDPGLVNNEPYGQGWIYRMKLADPGQADDLMDPAAYKEFCEGLE